MTHPVRDDAEPDRRRILVVDADHRVRDSLAGVIALADGLEVVGTASHLGEAVDAVRALSPDVVLLDPDLPDIASGRALLDRLRALRPAPRVFIMSWATAAENAELVAQADGFIEKCSDPASFTDAVIAAALSADDRPAAGIRHRRPAGRPHAVRRGGRVASGRSEASS